MKQALNSSQNHLHNLAWIDYLAAVILTVSGFIFVTLVVGNYLVFSPNIALQALGSDFLTPVYYVSVVILRLSPFDEGLWAFSAYCILLLSVSIVRARENGLRRSLFDTLTLIGPAILVCFEVGVFFLVPSYFYSHVTNFVQYLGLGHIFTNASVLVISAAVLTVRQASKRMRSGIDSGACQ